MRALGAEWEQAIRTATVRLNDGWVLPETETPSPVVAELAAFLCAYGSRTPVA